MHYVKYQSDVNCFINTGLGSITSVVLYLFPSPPKLSKLIPLFVPKIFNKN